MTLIVWTLVLCVLIYGPVTEACPSVCTCERSYLCDGTDVHCYYRGLTEVPTNIPTDTCELHLDRNKLTTIQDKAFASLHNLSYLYLSNNRITTIQDHVFARLHNVRDLYLHDNKITTIHDNAFAGLYNLRELYISRNNITVLDKDIFLGLSNLEIVAVENNPLHCGCILADFVRFAEARNLRLGYFEPACSTPSNLTGVLLRDLSSEEMNCDVTTPTTPVLEITGGLKLNESCQQNEQCSVLSGSICQNNTCVLPPDDKPKSSILDHEENNLDGLTFGIVFGGLVLCIILTAIAVTIFHKVRQKKTNTDNEEEKNPAITLFNNTIYGANTCTDVVYNNPPAHMTSEITESNEPLFANLSFEIPVNGNVQRASKRLVANNDVNEVAIRHRHEEENRDLYQNTDNVYGIVNL